MNLHPATTPLNLDAIRAIADEEARLAAYSQYLTLLKQRRATVIAERAALIERVRHRESPPTYRRLAALTGLSEGYVRQVAGDRT